MDDLNNIKAVIVEDETSFAALLKRVLEQELAEQRFNVRAVATVRQARPLIQDGDLDVVLTDLHLPGGESGLELVKWLRDTCPRLPVILMTSKHTAEKAIEATKSGAYDYFTKPDPEDFDTGPAHAPWPWVRTLAEMILHAARTKRFTEQVQVEQTVAETECAGDSLIGRSRAMQTVYKEIGRVAARPVSVLIRGETGTGKELVARAIYQHSDRHNKPFIVVNCSAIPENLLESELFGHEPGVFTGAIRRRIGRFEQAREGTIFLDEIGDMSLALQAKLLRVLQHKTFHRLGAKEDLTVDVRILAATHRNLEEAIQEGQFREDLYHRLNETAIRLPPLRERKEDLRDFVSPQGDRSIGLVRYFIQRHRAELGSPGADITEDGFTELENHSWPGNVRELRNVIRKALLLARGPALDAAVISEALARMKPPSPATGQSFSAYVSLLLMRAMRGDIEKVQAILTDAAERELYRQAIHQAQGDQSKAARWLGVSRPTVREKLTRYNLQPIRKGEG